MAPIYEYRCVKPDCRHEFERMQKMSEAHPACRKCGASVQKLMSRTSFALKGGGWYSDGYSSNPPPAKVGDGE